MLPFLQQKTKPRRKVLYQGSIVSGTYRGKAGGRGDSRVRRACDGECARGAAAAASARPWELRPEAPSPPATSRAPDNKQDVIFFIFKTVHGF